MRNARLQAQDLSRTNQFVSTLLTKEDVKDLEKPYPAEPPKQPLPQNGGFAFRSDAKAPRFSDPPAPPPQQPLPEKPDVPSLKRGPTERPKSGPPNAAIVRQENMNQIVQLTEALNSAKRDMDSQNVRMRELEEMLHKEREARELAEDLAKRLELAANAQVDGLASAATPDGGSKAVEQTETETTATLDARKGEDSNKAATAKDATVQLQSRVDAMDEQMRELQDQLAEWQQRCETAETERDESKKSLAQMVEQLRADEANRAASEERRRSRSRRRRAKAEQDLTNTEAPLAPVTAQSAGLAKATGAEVGDEQADSTLSRANTITPLTSQHGPSREQQIQASMPYASMLGVVLIGMGLMAYINGWQSPPPRIER